MAGRAGTGTAAFAGNAFDVIVKRAAHDVFANRDVNRVAVTIERDVGNLGHWLDSPEYVQQIENTVLGWIDGEPNSVNENVVLTPVAVIGRAGKGGGMTDAVTVAIPRVRPTGSDRRRQLIDCAYDLLAEQGLDALTIRAVLDRTGLARRAFYESFGGKDDLVLAVFEETLELAANHYGQLTQGIADPVARLEFIVTAIVLGQGYAGDVPGAGSDRRGAALSREHMRLAESHPAQLQRALSPLLDLLSRHLAEGMATGAIRKADPDRMAALVYNLVSTTVHTELLAAEGQEVNLDRRKALASDIWDFCRQAIRP